MGPLQASSAHTGRQSQRNEPDTWEWHPAAAQDDSCSQVNMAIPSVGSKQATAVPACLLPQPGKNRPEQLTDNSQTVRA